LIIYAEKVDVNKVDRIVIFPGRQEMQGLSECNLLSYRLIDLDISTVSACVMRSLVTFSYRVSKNDSTK